MKILGVRLKGVLFFVALVFLFQYSNSLSAEESYPDTTYKKVDLNFSPRNTSSTYKKFFGNGTPMFGDMISSFANRVSRQDVERTQILFGSGETYHFDGMNFGLFYGDSDTYGVVYRKEMSRYLTVFFSGVSFVEDYRLIEYQLNGTTAFRAKDKSFNGYSVGITYNFPN